MTTRGHTDLVILGAGGHGREILDIVEAINTATPEWRMLGFLDDDPDHMDRIASRNTNVLGPISPNTSNAPFFAMGIGDGAIRSQLDRQFTSSGRTAASLIHPLASYASDNSFADGVVMSAGARVTTNVYLGRHVHLNVNAVVSHDCVVGDYSTLSPGAMLNGSVTLGQGVFLGTGAIVTPGVSIGEWARVGAGAVVLSDVPARSTVVGIPAH